jgi:hypothetical protein
MDWEVLTLDGRDSTVCDVQQHQQSLPSQTKTTPSTTYLTRGQAIGLVVSDQFIFLVPLHPAYIQITAEAAFLTIFSVIFIFILITVFLILLYVPVRL